jgi:hypothetical protein
MNKKQIVVVTNSSNYEPRAELVAAYFRRVGHVVTVIESDFSHSEKRHVKREQREYIYINTISYYKNISVRRLYSHYNFSVKYFKEIKKRSIDLLYVLVPANSLVKFTALYKKLYPSVKIVYDIIDLWPESLPLIKLENVYPINIWRNLRNNYLGQADLIVSECKLYQNILKRQLEGLEVRTLYWPKNEMLKPEFPNSLTKKELDICYIGSINNIIDIPFIVTLLKKIKFRIKVTLHIIGDGEKKVELLEELKKAKIELQYYGKVYDEKIKNDIIRHCHYGLNIMKADVCVGLTMKSVEYLAAGIPLINNIQGDTWDFVELEDVGLNCISDSWDENEIVERIVSSQCDMERRKRARLLYEKLFSPWAFEKKIEEYMKPLVDDFE